MHSFIVQLEKEPIPKNERLHEDDLGGFVGPYADYVDENSDRWPQGTAIMMCLPQFNVLDDESVEIDEVAVEQEAEKHLARMKEEAEKILDCSVEDYLCTAFKSPMYSAVHGIRDEYADEHCVFVYSREWGCMPLMDWIRYHIDLKPNRFFVGTVVDYHY